MVEEAVEVEVAVEVVERERAAHLARLLHVILERLPRRVVREVADEDGRAAPAVPGAHRPAAALAVAAALALLAAVVLADDNLAAVELGVHQGLDRVRRARLVGELDDAEAGRAAVLPRLHVGAHHLARLLHVVLERLPRRLVREVADVDGDHVCWLLRRDRGAARPQTQVNRARRSFFVRKTAVVDRKSQGNFCCAWKRVVAAEDLSSREQPGHGHRSRGRRSRG